MRLVTLLALALLVVILVVVLVIGAGGWFRVRQAADEGDPLLDLTEPDVAALTIAAHGRPVIELHKHADQWFITAPVHGRAEDVVVRRAVLAVCNLRVARTFRPNDPQRPPTAQTGLGIPRLVATLTDLKGEKHVVRFGDHPPLIRHLYAQLGATNDFHLVGPNPVEDLNQPFGAFRDKRLLAIDPVDVGRVTVTGQEAYALVRTNGRWRLIDDGGYATTADASRVRALLDHLAGLEIVAFTPSPVSSPAAVGLDPPAATFLLELQLPGPRVTGPTADDPTGPDCLRLAVGTHEGAVYAMVENDGWPVKLAPTALAPLIGASETYRDRRLLPVEAAAITRMTARREGRAVTVTRRDGRRLDALTAALTEPRIRDFITRYTSLRGFGLDDAPLRWEIDLADGTVSTLALGAADADGRIYLLRDEEPTVIMARAAELATIAETLLGGADEANRPPSAAEVPQRQSATP